MHPLLLQVLLLLSNGRAQRDGMTWKTIEGATSSRYTIKAEDVGLYLRSVATGTGFYNGEAISLATAKVTPLAGSGS